MYTLVIHSHLVMLPHEGMFLHSFEAENGVMALAVRENYIRPYWAMHAVPF